MDSLAARASLKYGRQRLPSPFSLPVPPTRRSLATGDSDLLGAPAAMGGLLGSTPIGSSLATILATHFPVPDSTAAAPDGAAEAGKESGGPLMSWASCTDLNV